MKLDVDRARELVAWAKRWSPFDSTGRVVAEIGDKLYAALEECAHQTKLADLAERAMLSAYEASKGLEAIAQTYFDAKEPLEQLRDGLIKLRDDIDQSHMDWGWQVVDQIDALLALAPKEPA